MRILAHNGASAVRHLESRGLILIPGGLDPIRPEGDDDRVQRCLGAAVCLLTSWLPLGAQETPSLQTVLDRSARYVEEFHAQLSGIVAEETYEQVVTRTRPTPDGFTAARLQRRRLKSDLLLMRPENGISWIQFRDVFEVDGRPVRDRQERLSALFLQSPATTLERTARIIRESARYNIGNVDRTLNIPVLPLAVLDAAAQRRFAFSIADGAGRGRGRDLPSSPRFRVSTEMWAVRFRETRGPTLVRSEPDGRDLLSEGRLWIEPESGRVRMSELMVQNGPVRAQINVSYQSAPLLGFLVPIEMREKYTRRDDSREITGRADYGRFRQFRVQVEEKIEPIR